MKANKLLLMFLATISLSAVANDDIPLRQGGVPPEGEPTDPRSITSEVLASIESQVVTVSFSELTTSQIVVSNSSNQTVYNQTYSASYSVQADLSSLAAGNYTLYIYALGGWWTGHFEIE